MRATKQRETIKQAVLQSCDHPSAETIYERVKETLPDVSLGTVYRNLNLLAENGEILKIGVAGGKDRFDKTTCVHAHFHCTSCDRVLDFGVLDGFDGAVSGAVEASGCLIHRIDILAEGLCPDCKGDAK